MKQYGWIGYDPKFGSKDDYICYLEQMIEADKEYIGYLWKLIGDKNFN